MEKVTVKEYSLDHYKLELSSNKYMSQDMTDFRLRYEDTGLCYIVEPKNDNDTYKLVREEDQKVLAELSIKDYFEGLFFKKH